MERALALAELGELLRGTGEIAKAKQYINEAVECFARLGDEHQAAVASGSLADILTARGELDEALAIRREKELPVYERLGDVRELVVARVKIALILLQRGRAEDVEPAFEHLAWSHQTARRLGLREAEQIEEILHSILGSAGESSTEETET